MSQIAKFQKVTEINCPELKKSEKVTIIYLNFKGNFES